MAERQTSPVLIELNSHGTIRYLGFRETPLIAAISAQNGPYQIPFAIKGGEVDVEVEALKHALPALRWHEMHSVDDLPGATTAQLAVDHLRRMDGRYFGFLPTAERAGVERLLAGPVLPKEVLVFSQSVMASNGLSRSSEVFTTCLERLFGRSAVVLAFNESERLFPLIALSLWMRRARKYPLVIRGEGEIPIDAAHFMHFPTSIARFEDLLGEINRVVGTPREEIEKAYRVWQISRRAADAKPRATTPKYITINTAKSFLGVLTRARTEREVARVALQRPAPVMFEFDQVSIGLKHGASTTDSAVIISAAASSLMRGIERLLGDHSLSNAVPSAGEILDVALEILVKVRGGSHSDADIVELGMDLNSLQYHIDSVGSQIGDATLGELTGLFSSAQMLLSRFKIWREFESAPGAPGAKTATDPESYGIAIELLQGARTADQFLTPEANTRIDVVLARASVADAPSQHEGVVRSGENLAAITAEYLSRIAISRATSNPDRNDASEAVVQYVQANGPRLKKLGKRRNWPWLNWLDGVLG